ncbi:hypothetical protein LVD15_26365 [Fulvivirga maritima]|uniref:immunoglobulin domain-containing protein n=1 Tax=Fulvivirga maritima TaxID=2904247 RepID=UPI001F3B8023|nr:hypothetical protein [Fulvivirga maritima]UII26776.1 hypothetical protein LVD15_26365 [Fulvivirga maritima]
MYSCKNSLITIVLLSISNICLSQYAYITGPDSVVLGGSATYNVVIPDEHGDVLTSQWYANAHSCNGCSVSYHLFRARYTFDQLGTKEIEFEYDSENYGSDLVWKDVIVYDPPQAPETPTIPIIISNCEKAVLTRGDVPEGETWFWQILDHSKVTTYGSGSTFEVGQSGWYYLRAKNNNTGIWSNYSSSIWVEVNEKPMQATGIAASRCLPGSVSLKASPGGSGTTIKWYAAAVGGSPVHIGLTFKTDNLSSSTTFYAASFNEEWGCECDYRESISAIVKDVLPNEPDPDSDYLCGDEGYIELKADAGNGANTIRWYSSNNDTSLLHTGTLYKTPSISKTTTYYISSYSSEEEGCESLRVPIVAAVNAVPMVDAGEDKELCTNEIVNLVGSPSGGIWSGLFVDNNVFSAINSGVGVYEVAYAYTENYDIGYCTGKDTIHFDVSLEAPEKPAYPKVFKNYWSEWKLIKSESPINERWCWQGSDLEARDITNVNNEYIANGTAQYYLRAQNIETSCWSDPTIIDVFIATENGYDGSIVNEPLGNN